MYRMDVRGAWLLIILLWVVTLFILIMAWPHIPDAGVRWVTGIAAAAVLIFNTAAMLAMLKHYAQDKSHIYSLDLWYLDEIKEKTKGGA